MSDDRREMPEPMEPITLSEIYDEVIAHATEETDDDYDVEAGLARLHAWIDEQDESPQLGKEDPSTALAPRNLELHNVRYLPPAEDAQLALRDGFALEVNHLRLERERLDLQAHQDELAHAAERRKIEADEIRQLSRIRLAHERRAAAERPRLQIARYVAFGGIGLIGGFIAILMSLSGIAQIVAAVTLLVGIYPALIGVAGVFSVAAHSPQQRDDARRVLALLMFRRNHHEY